MMEQYKEEHDQWRECKKHQDHSTFIPVHEFQLKHLPSQCQREEFLNYVKFWSNFVVKVVRSTGLNGPRTYPQSPLPNTLSYCRGTSLVSIQSSGMIDVSRSHHLKQSCFCPICKVSGNPKEEYWTFIVHTATHVVCDDEEAASTTFQCFYDSEENDNDKNKLLFGTKLFPSLYKKYKLHSDRCKVLCITHDSDLVEKLLQLSRNAPHMKPFYKTDVGVLISHPHGVSKRITVGRILHIHVNIGQDTPVNTPIEFGGAEYRLPSEWNQTEEERGNSFLLQAGTHKIPPGMMYVLPEGTNYCHRFGFLDIPWFTFPPGTTYKYNEREFYFPVETKFAIDYISWPFLFVTYDVDTCFGSCGAPMLMDWGGSPLGAFRHLGAQGKGINFSGNQFYLA